VSASPGGLGGSRSLVHVRAILGNMNVYVIPDQLSVSKAHEAFNADGSLKDNKQQEAVEKIARGLVVFTNKLKS